MRVLFVNPGGDAAGGAERSLALLIGGLNDRGHQVAAITLVKGDAAASFQSAGAQICTNGVREGLSRARRHGSRGHFLRAAVGSLPEMRRVAFDIRTFASSFGADIIHLNGLRAHALSPLLARARRPVIWSLREVPPSELGRSVIRATARSSTAIIGPSRFATALVKRSRRPLYVIPNPVLALPHRDQGSCRRALGLPLDRRVVAVIAHMHPSKGQHVALDAWVRLPEPRPLLVFAGGDLYGPTSFDYRSSLERTVRFHGLGEDVTMLGLVHDLASLYGACDLVIHPALHPEGFGRSIAEAQSAGVPVIATRIGGPVELITDGVSGMLIEPGDVDALAGAVSDLLADTSLQTGLRIGGERASSRYNPKEHAASVERVYEAVSG